MSQVNIYIQVFYNLVEKEDAQKNFKTRQNICNLVNITREIHSWM